jgi:hypothetical protein
MKKQRLLVAGLVVALMAHTSAMAFDDLAKVGDAAAKALALVKQSRAAAGGEEQLAKVCVVTAKGTARRQGPDGEAAGPFAFKFFTRAVEGAELEMAGAPGDVLREKVVVVGPDGQGLDGKTFDVLLKAPADGAEATGDKRIVVRKIQVGEPGETSAEAGGEKRQDVLVFRAGKPGATESGDVIVHRVPQSDAGPAHPGFGRRMLVYRDSDGKKAEGDFAAMPPPIFDMGALDSFLSLILPDHGPAATYSYAGLLDTADGRYEAIDVTRPDGFNARFFFDPATHHPMMVTYKSVAAPPLRWKVQRSADDPAADKAVVARVEPFNVKLEEVEVQVRFDDFRSTGSVTLPHRLSVSTNGKLVEEIVLESFTAEACPDTN